MKAERTKGPPPAATPGLYPLVEEEEAEEGAEEGEAGGEEAQVEVGPILHLRRQGGEEKKAQNPEVAHPPKVDLEA